MAPVNAFPHDTFYIIYPAKCLSFSPIKVENSLKLKVKAISHYHQPVSVERF